MVRAADCEAELALSAPPGLRNVIGSLHSSGLIALVDAAGLAAMIAASDSAESFRGVVPLGAGAVMEFLAPGRGRLTASCRPGPRRTADWPLPPCAGPRALANVGRDNHAEPR